MACVSLMNGIECETTASAPLHICEWLIYGCECVPSIGQRFIFVVELIWSTFGQDVSIELCACVCADTIRSADACVLYESHHLRLVHRWARYHYTTLATARTACNANATRSAEAVQLYANSRIHVSSTLCMQSL